MLCFAIQTLSKRTWDVKQWAWDVKYRGLGCQVWPYGIPTYSQLTGPTNGYPPAASYRSCRQGALMTSVTSPFFAIQRLGSRVRARPCPGRSDEWISSGSFLQVMPAGRFDDHRPVYLPHFLRSSAWSRRLRARPFGGAAHRCDGGQSAGHPYCGGRLAFRRGPLCTAHA